jgi:tungstate transport system substrate-binding protein
MSALSQERGLPIWTLLPLLVVVGCGSSASPSLRIATTTSVENSGLMAHLQPAFKAHTGLDLLVQASGSGRALLLLERREVAVVISHAPDAEQRMLSQHPEWNYRKFAYNHFIIVGPPADPAGLRNARDAVDAFRRIAKSSSPFVSRGDESGTHEREQLLWALAGSQPAPAQLIVSGRGMAQAIRHADEARAYTLTDEPTFRQFERQLQLTMLFAGDERLVNAYAVIANRAIDDALAFQDWLTSSDGLTMVGSFNIAGVRAYEPWPVECPGSLPASTPCEQRQ